MEWASKHPRLVAWLVLSVGMIGLIGFEGRDVGLRPAQWLSLFVACILVAGACIWIISWEDEVDSADAGEGDNETQDTPGTTA
jgi:hypothetical protein